MTPFEAYRHTRTGIISSTSVEVELSLTFFMEIICTPSFNSYSFHGGVCADDPLTLVKCAASWSSEPEPLIEAKYALSVFTG